MPSYNDYFWNPADRGYIGETYDGTNSAASSVLSPAGTLFLCRIKVPAAGPVTLIAFGVNTAGVSLTAGQCFAALFYTNGNLIAQSADQSTNWAGTGQKNATLDGGPYFLHAGEYYVGFWYNGTTAPSLHRASNITGSSINNGRTTSNYIIASANTGLTTAAPSTFTFPLNNSTAHIWMALK